MCKSHCVGRNRLRFTMIVTVQAPICDVIRMVSLSFWGVTNRPGPQWAAHRIPQETTKYKRLRSVRRETGVPNREPILLLSRDGGIIDKWQAQFCPGRPGGPAVYHCFTEWGLAALPETQYNSINERRPRTASAWERIRLRRRREASFDQWRKQVWTKTKKNISPNGPRAPHWA